MTTPPGYQLVPVEPTDEMLGGTAQNEQWKEYWRRAWRDMLAAAPQPPAEDSELLPETADLADRFSAALKDKLLKAQLKYGYDKAEWRRDDWETACRAHLYEHLAKGDPRDVANYCAFMWHHGWSTARPAEAPVWQPIETAPRDGTIIDLWGEDQVGPQYEGEPRQMRLTDCWWDTAGDNGWVCNPDGDTRSVENDLHWNVLFWASIPPAPGTSSAPAEPMLRAEVTDEQVERACVAFKAADHPGCPNYWDDTTDESWKKRYRGLLRAALEAAFVARAGG